MHIETASLSLQIIHFKCNKHKAQPFNTIKPEQITLISYHAAKYEGEVAELKLSAIQYEISGAQSKVIFPQMG